jgi:hypothetical protein
MTDAKRHAASGSSMGLDHGSLRGEPGASHTHYSVALKGDVEERWTSAFRAVCAQSGANRVFVLNPRSATVSFSCRTLEGPALVFEMLDRLEKLLAAVDRRVASGPAPRTGTSASTPPPPPRRFAE